MAVAHKRVAGAALTGSGALGHEDAWSDIDLAFGVADEVDLAEMIADLSDRIYQEHAVVHHTDVTAGATIDSGAAVKAARSAAAAVSGRLAPWNCRWGGCGLASGVEPP